VQLYRGDLLEGSYQEWCLQERGRLQTCYLAMLTKLTRYCHERGEYPRGIEYGQRILRLDPAHERSHQQLMTLYFQSGDRTAALRQYERCKAALHDELGVEPSRQTRELYQRMRSDPADAPPLPFALPELHEAPDAVGHLQRLLEFVTDVEAQIKREIRNAERAVPDLGRRLASSGQR
jgi:DNA-binding SARP family transcriptional activator